VDWVYLAAGKKKSANNCENVINLKKTGSFWTGLSYSGVFKKYSTQMDLFSALNTIYRLILSV
jgi:hypothetical protein